MDLELYRTPLTHHCYRMLGEFAEAEDVAQETLFRASQNELDRGRARGWLFTVATRLSIDILRKRKRREYSGVWIPEPIETNNPEKEASDIETLTIGYLLALESLSETQRALLLLQDVCGFTGAESASMVDLKEPSARKQLQRARETMRSRRDAVPRRRYDRDVVRGKVLMLIAAMTIGDVDAMLELLADDVHIYSDTDGKFAAAHRVVKGFDRATKLLLALGSKYGPAESAQMATLNGWPAFAYSIERSDPRIAERGVVLFDADKAGKIRDIYLILNPEKCGHLTQFQTSVTIAE